MLNRLRVCEAVHDLAGRFSAILDRARQVPAALVVERQLWRDGFGLGRESLFQAFRNSAMQNLTTREPSDDQLEVAIHALQESLKLEPQRDLEPVPLA